jgi:hypothetical protein
MFWMTFVIHDLSARDLWSKTLFSAVFVFVLIATSTHSNVYCTFKNVEYSFLQVLNLADG